MILYHYNSKKYVTLTFDHDFTLTVTLIFDLETAPCDRYLVQEHSTTSGSKVMAQKVIFMVFDVFDLDLHISRSFEF